MRIEVLKSKIHRVRVTVVNIHYVGSISIDESLLQAASIYPNQKVQVVDINNGERLETYVTVAPAGSGEIALNGAAARKAVVGDILLIIAYGFMEEEDMATFSPKVIFPNEDNHLSA